MTSLTGQIALSHWITLAPIHNLWTKPSPLPFRFSNRVSIQEIPSPLLRPDTGDLLRDELHRRMDGATHCLMVEYEAPALDASQAAAVAEIYNVMLSLWLARPTALHFITVAHIRREGTGFVTRQAGTYNPFLAMPEHQPAEFEPADFKTALSLYTTIAALNAGLTIHSATRALMRALTEPDWSLRYLLIWIAIEALFGAESEITFRLSQRVGLFLGTTSSEAHALFKTTKKGYAWRSKVVHGMHLARLQTAESTILMGEIQDLIRPAMSKILSTKVLIHTFDGRDREAYLDALAFR